MGSFYVNDKSNLRIPVALNTDWQFYKFAISFSNVPHSELVAAM